VDEDAVADHAMDSTRLSISSAPLPKWRQDPRARERRYPRLREEAHADINRKVVEHNGGQAFTFAKQAQEQVFGPDVAVV
jgi:hypothetical protein